VALDHSLKGMAAISGKQHSDQVGT
jgi:hypothetical protein